MSKDPAFLFYPSDFLTGVADLTMEERGQFITLLCLEHQKGRLSEKMISLCCGNATADVLAKFCKDGNGFFYNKRLEIEIEKRKEHAEKQRQRAIDGWVKRKATADATALPLENENVNRDENVNNQNLQNSNLFRKPKVPQLSEVQMFFRNNGGNDEMAQKFFDKWEGVGWYYNNSPIVNFASFATNFISNYKKLENGKQNIKPIASNDDWDFGKL